MVDTVTHPSKRGQKIGIRRKVEPVILEGPQGGGRESRVKSKRVGVQMGLFPSTYGMPGGPGPKTQRRRIKTKTKSKNTRKLYRRRDRIVTGTPQEKTKMKTKNKIKNKSKNKTKNKTKNKLRIKAKNKQNKNSINKIFK
jgi:hypothetical protein